MHSFSSNMIYSCRNNLEQIQNGDRLLFDQCKRNGFRYIDNSAVLKNNS